MTILEELYNGNINPSSRFIKNDSEYQKVNHQLTEYLDKLMMSLDDEENSSMKK